MIDFVNMDVSTLSALKTAEGVPFLQLFLQEYRKVFNETVNAGCSKCINNYLIKYKRKMAQKTENPENSGYRLKAKYENIPLEFGSPVLINNTNLTDAYAEKLLSRKDGERYFDRFPEKAVSEKSEEKGEEKTVKEEEEVSLDQKHAELIDAYIKAENDFNALPEKTHHKTREAAKSRLQKASDALSDFRKENNLIEE